MSDDERLAMQAQAIAQLQDANHALRVKLRKALVVLRELHRLDLTARAEDAIEAITPEDML